VVRWFWLTLSPVLLGGLALMPVVFRKTEQRDAVVAMVAAIAFPILYVVGTRATLYDGVRHLLFVFPPLVILAAAGWIAAWRAPSGWPRAVVAIVASAGVMEPAVFQWRNHPNQTAYIQPLAGGPRAAYANYDLDYWGNCLLQAMRSVNDREPAGRVYM